MFQITTERPEDSGPIQDLLDASFGPRRQEKSSYRYRQGLAAERHLCLVARSPRDVRPSRGNPPAAAAATALVGTIRYWPIGVGPRKAPALLLGPLAVAAGHRSAGVGAALMRTSLDMAAWAGHPLVLLVGDLPYYGRFGFTPAVQLGITMASESVDRVLALALRPADLTGHQGVVAPWRSVRRRASECPRLAAAA
jgi:predicted N-acetyltransferase YhbS